MKWSVVSAVAVSLLPSVQAAQPWDAPFKGEPGAIMQSAKQISSAENSEITILLDDHHYSVHSDGRIDSVIRRVYRIDQQDAVEDWAAVEQGYRPWHQNKPELRARVIGIDGAEHWLDPKTIADAPAREVESNIFSDDRIVRAPLPSVAAGSVVEYEITTRDRAPLLDAGTSLRIIVDDATPIQRFHAVIESEPGIVLRTAARLIPATAIHREETAGRTRVEADLGPLKMRKHLEFNLPPDESNRPMLSFSTGKSWQAVAA